MRPAKLGAVSAGVAHDLATSCRSARAGCTLIEHHLRQPAGVGFAAILQWRSGGNRVCGTVAAADSRTRARKRRVSDHD